MDFWSIFGVKRSGIKRTDFESVQIGILIAMEQLIKDAREYNVLQKTKVEPTPIEMGSEVKALMSAGFTNHKLVIEYENRIKQRAEKIREAYEREIGLYHSVKALRTLMAARQYYGDDTLYLPFDKFGALCKKYDLKCGEFADYMGDVPNEKLNEILSLQRKGRQLNDIIMFRPIRKIENRYYSCGDDEEAEVRRHFSKFPFVRSADGFRNRHIVHIDGTEREYAYVDFEFGEYTQFFITAPKHMFKKHSLVKKNKDPFICSITDLGVLIFTRWGEEADDEIICRAEDFNFQLKALKL